MWDPNTVCRISEKWYTGLLSHLAGELHHIANISCRCCPNLCRFLDLGRYSVHKPTYQFSKQADKISNCSATSKVEFCTFPATSGAGWPGHPNFEMLYLAQFSTVSCHTYTVRKVFVRAFSPSKNIEKQSKYEIVIDEIHEFASCLTVFSPAIQHDTHWCPKLGILLLYTSQANIRAWDTGCVSGWRKRAKTAPLCFTSTVSHIHDAF